MDGNKVNLKREGAAVFLEWEGSGLTVPDYVWEVRQQTKTMLQLGTAPRRFVVTEVVKFSPGVINEILGGIYAADHHLSAVTGDMDGEVDGKFSCAALWDTQLCDGVLIHRSGVQWLVAALPIIDAKAAKRERQMADELAALAMKSAGIPINLTKSIEPGRYALSDLLDILSEQIDV